jgi:hypothetical protein
MEKFQLFVTFHDENAFPELLDRFLAAQGL